MLSTWVVCGAGLALFALLLVVDVSANADVDLRQIKPASLVNICQGWSKEGHLPAEILLEDTDGLRRPPFYNPSVTSRCGSPLLLLTCALLMTSSHSEGCDSACPALKRPTPASLTAGFTRNQQGV